MSRTYNLQPGAVKTHQRCTPDEWDRQTQVWKSGNGSQVTESMVRGAYHRLSGVYQERYGGTEPKENYGKQEFTDYEAKQHRACRRCHEVRFEAIQVALGHDPITPLEFALRDAFQRRKEERAQWDREAAEKGSSQ